MGTTTSYTINGNNGPTYSIGNALDWHSKALIKDQLRVERATTAGQFVTLTLTSDYTVNEELDTVTFLDGSGSPQNQGTGVELRFTRVTKEDGFYASMEELGAASAFSALSNDEQLQNRMQEVEARLDQVTGNIALTFNGDLVTSLVAGTGISMAVTSAGALTITNSGSGTGDTGSGNDFNTATFDAPIANQTADSNPILDLTFATAGLHNDASLLSYLNTNSYATQSYVNTNTLTPTQVTDEISTRLAGYTVKSLAAGANIGLTADGNGQVTVAYTGPAPVSNPTGAILMWGGPIANQNEAPSGYKWCNGDDLNTFDFKDLHAVISNTYGGTAYTAGVTDQSGVTTTFKLPNMLGNVAVGAQSLQNYNLGNTGGQTEHTISAQEMPNHRHNSGTFETRPHYHHTVAMTSTGTRIDQTTAPYVSFTRTNSYTLGGVTTTPSDGKTGIAKGNSSGHVNSIGEIDVIGKTGEEIFTTTSDSSEVETQQAISLMQPYVALNYIIKT